MKTFRYNLDNFLLSNLSGPLWSLFFNSCSINVFVFFFFSNHLLHFFIAFELRLVPVLILVLRKGSTPEKISACLWTVFYTVCGSLPLLVSILVFASKSCSDRIFVFFSSQLPFFFIFAFLVKLPIFGLHSWLPLLHVQAPVYCSMFLAGVLLKMGGYGLFIISGLQFSSQFLCYLALHGACLAMLICFVENDLKVIVAYSRIGHIALVLASLLVGNFQGQEARILIIVAHGFVSSGLFYVIDILYNSSGSRRLSLVKGLNNSSKALFNWRMIFLLLNCSLPPTLNFLAEVFGIVSLTSLLPTVFCQVLLLVLFCGLFNMLFLTRIGKGVFISSASLTISSKNFRVLICHIIPVLIFSLWFFR